MGETTADRTLVRGGDSDAQWRPVVAGPGEPHRWRTELCPEAVGGPPPTGRRRGLFACAHLTDVHLVDAQSPARVEFLDRYVDPGHPLAARVHIQGSYRPQELMSLQVADGMVRRIREVGAGPVSGVPLSCAVATGDNCDNSQFNELRWFIDILDGGRITPDSGDPDRYEGVADWEHWDPHYWHPDGAPPGVAADVAVSRYGFPALPGLLEATRAPFDAAGLGIPWYAAYGNHDRLLQGNAPQLRGGSRISTGGRKVVELPSGTVLGRWAADLVLGRSSALHTLRAGLVRAVAPDPDRRLVGRAEMVEQHFHTRGTPVGHGFTEQNRREGTAYYGFDAGVVRGLVLDTVNELGGPDGALDRAQFRWLTGQLEAHRDRIVIVFSHHTAATMGNWLGAPLRPAVLGHRVRDLLLRHPQVVAWVNGHTHVNKITEHPGEGGGGFWEITTAAHIDWPQQARIIELIDNADGTLSLATTIIDTAAPADPGVGPGRAGDLGAPTTLVALARQVSANDWQARDSTPDVDHHRGTPTDRNTELLVPAPPGVPLA